MNETQKITNAEREISPKEQARFDVRTLDTLLERFRVIEEHQNATGKEALVEYMFSKMENIKDILTDSGVTREDTISDIISKLDEAKAILEHEKNFVWPQEEKPKEAANDNGAEEIRGKVMDVQDQLNELYRLNNESLDEEERIKSATAFLEIFAVEKNDDERVEVARTKGGEVEAVFEEDVLDAEFLREVAHDIRETERRIAEYDKAIEESSPTKTSGLFSRLFQGRNTQPDTEIAPDSEGIAGKKMRAELALADKIAVAEARETKLQNRLEEKNQALRNALLVSGIDSFDGTWGELLQELREKVQKVQESLEGGFAARHEEIERLERERENIGKQEQAA